MRRRFLFFFALPALVFVLPLIAPGQPAAGKEVRKLKGHTFWVTALAFSPDGKKLASASNDKTVQVWNLATGKSYLTLNGEAQWGFLAVAFSPSGKLLAAAEGNKVRLWEAATGKEVLSLQGHRDQINAVAFSPDGRFLVSGSDDTTILVWDLRECSALLGASRPAK